jgi:hypothetical protein
MLVAVNGLNATLLLDNKTLFTHTYQPRVVDGYSYGLNAGMVGVGSNNSRGSFDNIRVQVLPPQVTFDATEHFDGLPSLSFSETSGTWSVGAGRFGVTPDGLTGISLLDLGPDHLNASSYLALEAKVSTAARAGFVFDRYDDGSFKFVSIDAAADRVTIGYYTPKRGWVSEATVSKPIDAGAEYTLGVALKGTTASVTLNGQVVLGHSFYASTVDGRFGLMATGAQASFDDVRVKTNDAAFIQPEGGSMMTSGLAGEVQSGQTLTQAELDAIATVVISQWTDTLGSGDPRLASLADVRFGIADLPQGDLGHTDGNTIMLDADGAGLGWYADVSPADSSEFSVRLDRNVLAAAPDSEAYGRFDLVTVLAHELGHVLGLDHADAARYTVMAEDIDPGVRYVVGGAEPATAPAAAPAEPVSGGIPAFDFAPLSAGSGSSAAIDWQSSLGADWAVQLSPYAPLKPVQKPVSNLAQFAAPPAFDSLGKALLGKGK